MPATLRVGGLRAATPDSSGEGDCGAAPSVREALGVYEMRHQQNERLGSWLMEAQEHTAARQADRRTKFKESKRQVSQRTRAEKAAGDEHAAAAAAEAVYTSVVEDMATHAITRNGDFHGHYAVPGTAPLPRVLHHLRARFAAAGLLPDAASTVSAPGAPIRFAVDLVESERLGVAAPLDPARHTTWRRCDRFDDAAFTYSVNCVAVRCGLARV